MNTPAAKKLTAARTSLVLDDPFFGTLALSLVPKEDVTCDTAWTDGRNLGYNPTFVESLTHAELTGLIRHETLHCAMGHPWRRDGREHRRFNVAADLAINPDCGTLPKGALVPDASQLGKSAEWIYARLPESKPDPNGNGGQGKGKDKSKGGCTAGTPGTQPGTGKPSDPQAGKGNGTPDPAGEVRDAPTQADADGTPAPTEGEWKQRTAEALQAAKLQGSMPGGLLRKIEGALDTRVDVKALLLRFFTERCKADYSWHRPNPRFLAMSLYLPVLESTTMGEIAILVDTSGSTSSVALQFARGVLEQVLDEVKPAGITLYFVDTKIHGTHRMEPGDTLTWEPKGGGGTCFASFFEAMENPENPPVCIVGISDLYANFGDIVPAVPVLWLTDSANKQAPFGETIFIDR